MTLRSRDLDLEMSRHVTFLVPKFFFIILDVLDIPDDFGEKKIFSPYKGSGLRFFTSRDFLCQNIFFIILDVLDIPDDFRAKKFCYSYKGSGLRFFGENFFSRPRDLFGPTYSFSHSGHIRHP